MDPPPLLIVFTMPIALDNIGWKTYMINGAWDMAMLVAILYYWIETKGKTLEEIDELIEGERHSDIPDLEKIIRGDKVHFDHNALEVEEEKQN
ncbi:hypothetical protein GGU11DRAFT_748234 [Lentinula aff. detonsa]|nr:hypothetical protein GGU11DRAFT_748234 [Lentinula aff. detonsa]